MKPSDRRAALKQDMAKRHQESYDRKDDSGRFKSIFKKDATSGINQWKCSEDEHFINIIPYIAGTHHPNVKEGDWAYNLDIFVHRKVGVNEDSYICLARTYGKPCPICEHQADLRKGSDFDEDYVKSLNPTRRVIYNIECLDSDKEIKKGVQLWEVSHYLFEKEVAELAKKPRGGGFVTFSDPDDGKILFFRKAGSGATNTEYKAFKFEDRSEPVSDEVLDAAHCLDELIHVPSYQEVMNAFHGSVSDEEVSERHVDETRSEAASESSRRPSRSTSEPEPEPKPNAAEFQCPGNAPEDFSTFDACNNCPDVAECEKEYNALVDAEEARLKEEAEKKQEEERIAKEKAAAESTAAPSGIRRTRPGASGTPVSETPASTADTGERRVRRRPGQ